MKKKFSSFLLVITLIGTVLLHPITGQAIDYTADVEQRKNRPIESNQIAGWPDGPIVNADAAILMEANTGTILYAKIYIQNNILPVQLSFLQRLLPTKTVN